MTSFVDFDNVNNKFFILLFLDIILFIGMTNWASEYFQTKVWLNFTLLIMKPTESVILGESSNSFLLLKLDIFFVAKLMEGDM